LLVAQFTCGLDHSNAGQITPRGFFNQMIRSSRLPVPARLDPTVLAVGRLMHPDLIVPGPVFAHRSQIFCNFHPIPLGPNMKVLLSPWEKQSDRFFPLTFIHRDIGFVLY
jgi:hypothetical protein